MFIYLQDKEICLHQLILLLIAFKDMVKFYPKKTKLISVRTIRCKEFQKYPILISCFLASIRKVLKETLSKPEGKFFTEDLKTFLYLTKDDADYSILIDAIKRYYSFPRT